MRAKSIFMFGFIYSAALWLGMTVAFAAMRATGLDASHQKLIQNVGFIINIAGFAMATSFAMSRRAHGLFGTAPGPIAFRKILLDSRFKLAAGFALCAVLIDIAAYLASSTYFTGEMKVPPMLRLGFLGLVYCGLAWMAISERITSGAVNGSR